MSGSNFNDTTEQAVKGQSLAVAKAWGLLTLGTNPTITVTNGFNIASATWTTGLSGLVTVNFTTNMENVNYIVLPFPFLMNDSNAVEFRPVSKAVGTFDFELRSGQGGKGNTRSFTSGDVVYFAVFGDQ